MANNICTIFITGWHTQLYRFCVVGTLLPFVLVLSIYLCNSNFLADVGTLSCQILLSFAKMLLGWLKYYLSISRESTYFSCTLHKIPYSRTSDFSSAKWLIIHLNVKMVVWNYIWTVLILAAVEAGIIIIISNVTFWWFSLVNWHSFMLTSYKFLKMRVCYLHTTTNWNLMKNTSGSL